MPRIWSLLASLAALNSFQSGAQISAKSADIIAVEADPLADMSALQKVRFVMKSGQIYVE